jgi:lysophospholipase L1-like esterase
MGQTSRPGTKGRGAPGVPLPRVALSTLRLRAAVLPAVAAIILSLAACALAAMGCGSSTPMPSPFAVPSSVTLPPTAAANPQFGAGGLIVFDGDSLTYGTGAPGGQDYPNGVMQLLPEWRDGVNVAVPGQTWADMSADAPFQVDPLQSATRPHNVIVAWAGTNDMRRTLTAGRVWSELQQYCEERHERGWTVVVLTVLPAWPQNGRTRFEEERSQLNTIIRDRWPEVADALADVAADPRIGDPAGPDGRVYCTDGIHHNAAGNTVIAEVVAASLAPLVNVEYGSGSEGR